MSITAHIQGILGARMERLVEVEANHRPETPEEAAAMEFSGTLFGFNWYDGIPHDAVQDDQAEGYASGEHHHYKEVPVDLETVYATL